MGRRSKLRPKTIPTPSRFTREELGKLRAAAAKLAATHGGQASVSGIIRIGSLRYAEEVNAAPVPAP